VPDAENAEKTVNLLRFRADRPSLFACKVFLCVSAVALGLLPAAAQTTAPQEYLCTADALLAAPPADNLSEGAHTVILTWPALGNPFNQLAQWTAAGNPVLWYRVYRGTASGGPYTLLADCVFTASAAPGSAVAIETYSDLVPPNQTFYYVVTAVGGINGGGAQESGYSNQATAVIPLFDTLSVPNEAQNAALNESLGTWDQIAYGAVAGPLHEALATSDSLSVSQPSNASAQVNETLSTADALAVRDALLQTMAETLSASDALTTQHAHQAALGETLSTADALQASAGFVLPLAEALSTSDSLGVSFLAGVNLAEALGTADALGATSTQNANLAETLSTSDSLSELSTARWANLAETLTTSDGVAGTGTFPAAFSERLSTLDSITLTGQPPGKIESNIAIFLLGNYGTAPAGSCGFDLSIFGWGFTALSVANWNGAARATAYVSPYMLTMSVTATDLASAGQFPVTVTNPGAGSSAKKIFSVLPATPAIASAQVKGAVIAVTGSDFVPTTTIFWNGAPLPTTFLSQTSLQAETPPGVKAIGSNLVTAEDTGCFAVP
jgi:IPT/TIG domain-containing protein